MRKKIVFCMNRMIMGGTEKVLLSILKEFSLKNDYQISVLTILPIREKFILKELKKLKILHYSFSEEKIMPSFFLSKIWLKTKNKLINKRANFHLANSNLIIDFKNGLMQPYIKSMQKPKKILWTHISVNYAKEAMLYDYSIYDKMICLTNKAYKAFLEADFFPKEKLIVIYNPFNIEGIREKSKDPLEIKENYFLCVSRLDPDKDIDTLIDAYVDFIQSTGSSTKLLIVGTGRNEQHFKDKVKTLHATEFIIFMGQIDEPYAYMHHAKASLLSSYNEGSPLTIVESMICETLIISSNCPTGPSELLMEGQCGLLFEPGNARELRDIFIGIENQSINREKFIQEANQNLYRFDIKKITPQIERLFQSLL